MHGYQLSLWKACVEQLCSPCPGPCTQELKREPPHQFWCSRRSNSNPKAQDRLHKEAPYGVGERCTAGRMEGPLGAGVGGTSELPLLILSLGSGHCTNKGCFHQAATYTPFHSTFCSCSSCGRGLPASREVSTCLFVMGEHSTWSIDRLLSQPESRQKAQARCLGISEGLQKEQIYKQQTATFVLEARLNKLHLTAVLTLSCKDGPLRYFYLLYSWVW